MLEAGVITAIAVIWLLTYLPLKRVAGYAGFVDLITSCILGFLFIGTYAGMLTGVLASVLIGAFLRIVRKFSGYEKLQWCRKSGERFGRLRWINYT